MNRELDKANASGIPLTVHIRRILGTLDVLEAFHESGFLHLDISPENILLIGEGNRERITLIDYNSVHTFQEIRSGQSVYYSEKEGYTALEIRLGRMDEIGFASNLYALTAVFYRCITGKNLTVMQTVRSVVPELSDAKCIADMPDTVLSMLREILKKGLAPLACRRYLCCLTWGLRRLQWGFLSLESSKIYGITKSSRYGTRQEMHIVIRGSLFISRTDRCGLPSAENLNQERRLC